MFGSSDETEIWKIDVKWIPAEMPVVAMSAYADRERVEKSDKDTKNEFLNLQSAHSLLVTRLY